MLPGKMKRFLAVGGMIFGLCLVPIVLFAQWSSNPLLNLGVAVANGEQSLPKIAATSDGGCYISWFDNRSGQYCVYMQRLNAAGEPQWTQNGLLISNNPQSSSLVDYDLTADPSDNAIVVFTDMRNGAVNDLDVFVYKISPAGAFLWGANGIGLSPAVNSDFEANPKVAATPMGNVVVAWLKSGAANVITLQRLSGLGNKMWGEDGITLTGVTGHSLTSPDLVPADLDNVVALWKDNSGVPWSPTTWLYTQKFDPTGGPLWDPNGLLIYNLGHMSAWTYPEIISDATGGAFYAWYDSPSLSDFTVSVGHVNSAGTLVFPLNGILASTNSSNRLHMSPSITYISSSAELYAFWTETDFGQIMYGVYGQKFSPTGARLWTDGGHEFVPLTSSQVSFVSCMEAGEEVYVGYFVSPVTLDLAVKAFKTNSGGTLLWGPVLLSSETLGSKDDLEMTVNTENRAFFTWGDGRNDFSDVYAQNVNLNGTLGNPTPSQVTISIAAVNPPIVISPTGGSFDFNATLANGGATPASFDVWIMVQLPNLSWYGPVLGPLALNLPAGGSVTRLRSQSVPAGAPAGSYWYEGRVGTYPSVISDTSGFGFTKSAAGSWGSGSGVWENTGNDFDSNSRPITTPHSLLITSVQPNPFNPTTAISYQLAADSHVSLEVYDTAGRWVATLVDGWREAGTHEVTFDGSRLSSGVYLYKITAGNLTAADKMVLMK